MGNSRENLEKALRAIRAVEIGPTFEDLAQAPLIDFWVTVSRSSAEICLLGEVSNHPTLGTDDILTSPIVALNRTEGWGRSLSRWYRLGKPLFAVRDSLADQFKDRQGHPASVQFDCPGLVAIEDQAAVDQVIANFVNLVLAHAPKDPT